MNKRKIAVLAIEIVIVLWTIISVVGMMLEEPGDNPIENLSCFCFFTIDSNILSAAASVLCIIGLIRGRMSRTVSLIKFTGTAAVTVTFLTVMLFLAPAMGYGEMLSGHNFYLHLVGPVLALTGCFLPEDEHVLSFKECLWGVLPVVVYGCLYYYKVIVAKTWPDFYGFAERALWWVSLIAMLAATFLISAIMRTVKNRRVKRT